MPKYNFFDVKGKMLPADINDPVKKMLLEKAHCPEAVIALEDMEKHKNCGEIGVYELDNPKNIIIKTQYGVCEGFDLVETVRTSEKLIIIKKHIKNHNVSMKKEGKNGPDNR